MNKDTEKQYQKYLEANSLQSSDEELAYFLLDSPYQEDYDEAIEIYKKLGRDVDSLTHMEIMGERRRLTFDQFIEELYSRINFFHKDYRRINADKKMWPEEFLRQFRDYYMD